jgi:PAS domain S-box-containing protein
MGGRLLPEWDGAAALRAVKEIGESNMSRPALWLYLLGVVTFLVIALRRVLRRQAPLNDELYSKRIAIDHVHSCVVWVRADGTLGGANPAVARCLGIPVKDLLGRDWETIFPGSERTRVKESYSQALLMGTADLETLAERADGGHAHVNTTLVSVYDSKSRFVGHYCLMEDRTREIELEEQIRKLTEEQAPDSQLPLGTPAPTA